MTNGSEKIVLCTPLMEAVKVNHVGLVKLLIQNGAQVGFIDSKNQVLQHHFFMLRLHVPSMSPLFIPFKNGFSAVHLTLKRSKVIPISM